MRFISFTHTEFENMAFVYSRDEEIPHTVQQVLDSAYKIRFIFDPRIPNVYPSVRHDSSTSRKAPFIPARYLDPPATYKDLILNGFPYKTYSNAQYCMTDRTDRVTYMQAIRSGLVADGTKERDRRIRSLDWIVTGSSPDIYMRNAKYQFRHNNLNDGTSESWRSGIRTDNNSKIGNKPPYRLASMDTRIYESYAFGTLR